MSAFFSRIDVGSDFSEEGVSKAIDSNIDTILRKNMSRFQYAHATLAFDIPQRLPLQHLMDHRVRLPRLHVGAEAADQVQIDSVVDRLNRMLCVRAHPGARELLADALDLDPVQDAKDLVRIMKISPTSFHLLIRGRLGKAIKVSIGRTTARETRELMQSLIARLLVYHCAHQVQMIAARGNVIDRFPIRLTISEREQMLSGLYADAHKLLTALELISKKVMGESKQWPQRDFVKDLKPKAEEIVAGLTFSEDELLVILQGACASRRSALKQALTFFDFLRNQPADSLHKAIFGMTSFETLIFAVTRLVQLKDNASKIVGKGVLVRPRMIPFSPVNLPRVNDAAVSKAFLVYRSILLRDDKAEEIFNDTRPINLQDIWSNWQAKGDDYGVGGFSEIRPCFHFLNREQLSLPMAERLEIGQKVDVLPEFLLQQWAPKRRVGGVPHARLALEMGRNAHAQKQSHRPPNVRRASGKR